MTDVAGYRVLRTVAHGRRARLLLGFEDDRTVVLKVSEKGDPESAIEIGALSAAAGEHVVALEDVAFGEAETVLVLERLPQGSLAELLERRAALDAGEAVTILAPLAVTLDRIHAAGVAHGALSLGAVCFSADGAPTLVSFGGAELFAPGSPEVVLESVPGVVADRAALRELVGLVLGRVRGTRADAARRLAGSLADAVPSTLAPRLFDLAAAAPIRFADESADGGGEARVVEMLDPPDEAVPAAVIPAWLDALIPDPLRERVDGPLRRIREMWDGWQPRRRRIVLGVAAGGATIAIAFVVVPAGSPAPVVAPPTATAIPASALEEPALPDDPVEAAELLLALRERCVRDLSLLCLDDVGQPGSAALDDDRRLILSVQAGGEYPGDEIRPGALTLVERLGDSALITLPEESDPSSILMMRTAEGWRIRDYITTPQPAARGDRPRSD